MVVFQLLDIKRSFAQKENQKDKIRFDNISSARNIFFHNKCKNHLLYFNYWKSKVSDSYKGNIYRIKGQRIFL